MAQRSLTAAEAAFVTGVTTKTGIDPRVVVAWVQQEGAYAPRGTGGFNFLNLRPYPGDPYSSVSSGNFEQFASVSDAIDATVRRLKQPFAAPILASVKKSPGQQIAAIADTGWDADHYGGNGGINLKATFAKLFTPAALADKPEGAGAAAAVAATAGTGSAADAGSYDAKNAAHDAAQAAKNATDWVGPLTGWISGKAPYAAVYALLVLFSLFLGVVGILRLLGIRFGSVVEAAGRTAAAVAA